MENKKKFIVNILFYGLIVLIVYAVCKYALPALLPFLIAFVIAAALQKGAKKLSGGVEVRRKLFSAFLCTVFFVIFFFIVIFLGTRAVKAVANLAVSAPSLYNEKIVPLLGELSDWLEQKTASVDPGMSGEVEEMFKNLSQNMGEYISDFSVKAVKWVSGGVTGIPGFIVKLVVTVVSTFFMAADFPKIMVALKRLVPEKWRGNVEQGGEYIRNVVFIYIRSYSLLFLMTFAELSIGLLILQIPYAVPIALAIAVFDILPVLGTGGILLPWAVVLFALGKVPIGVGILVLYLIITVIRNTVEPKIVGKQIGLHPLLTLIAMFAGLKLFGIVGMLVCPVGLAVFVNLKKDGVLNNLRF